MLANTLIITILPKSERMVPIGDSRTLPSTGHANIMAMDELVISEKKKNEMNKGKKLKITKNAITT